jgi:hypothetical protein
MELEQMKNLWQEMSAEIEKQKKLTDSIIIKMTQSDYRNKINKILIPEAIGGTGGFAVTLFILLNLEKLNNWYLLACGIISAVILFAMPILSIYKVNKIRSINISGSDFKQILEKYSKGKLQFIFVQKLNFLLGAILLITILPVTCQIMDGVDVFTKNDVWLWYAIGFPFFYGFARWVFKHYVKTASDAENILRELQD